LSRESRVESRESEHVVPAKVYVAVFATLLVMTAATTVISSVNLGPWNTVVALGIAAFKAALVVLFFMNVKYSPRLTVTVIVGGLFWLGILIALTFGDFATRSWVR
jgi:cytochrome c oxidase subunit IV